MIKENELINLGLCLIDEEGKVIKTQIVSTKWSVNLEKDTRDLMNMDVRAEITSVLKHQTKLCIDRDNVIEKLLFGDE